MRSTNEADEMAQLNRIAPGKRVRGNIEKWASSTVSLRGGRIENSAGHPDAQQGLDVRQLPASG